MGIPSFYKWLVRKYPKISTHAVGEEGESVDGSSLTNPNPNGFEFDNLYLDMNEIIWDTFCPDEEEGVSEPTTIEDGFNIICQHIDSLFSIVRPRKLLYLAIDGVPPRAKWGRCCSRRFLTAKFMEIQEEVEERLRRQLEREGKQVLPKLESELFGSAVITPGTEFMQKLSKALKSYVSSRLRSNLGWRNIKVILSDANVPDEGEHKIVAFIRQQRVLHSYDPNTSHCIFGRDADFIILALATHEVHISILRKNHWNFKRGINKRLSTAESSSIVIKPYKFVHLWILREYLELDMQISNPPEDFQFDIERSIDDFVFMSFLVGNDFLPCMPSLNVDERAIDLLMFVYKKELKDIGGYLVDTSKVEDSEGGYIALSRVERFFSLVGSYEKQIFRKRSDLEDQKQKQKRRSLASNVLEEDDTDDSMTNATNKLFNYSNLLKNTNELKEKVKENMRNSGLYDDGVDRVRFGATGYKERYYKKEFSEKFEGDIETNRKDMVVKYTEGLHWTLLYYFQGPPSWTWYYPYHAGPFVSDLKGLSQIKIKFEKGSPLKPIENLMTIIPLRGVFALPKAYQALMTEDSPIIDPKRCYVIEMVIEGKRCVCQVPIIDEARLLSEARKLENELQDEEKERNTQRLDQLLVRCTHKLGSLILSFSEEQNEVKRAIGLSDEIGGLIWLPLEITVTGNHVCNNNEDDSVLCVFYDLPNDNPHIPRLVSGVECPNKIVSESDIREFGLWHEYPVWKPSYRRKSTGREAGRGKPKGGNHGSPTEETSERPNLTARDEGLEKNAESSSSSSREPSQYFGPKWLAGRGKPNNSDDARAPANCASKRTNDQRVTNNAYVLPNFHGSRRGEQPLSSQNAGSFRPGNNKSSFWPSRNGNTRDENQSWRRSSDSDSSCGRGRGRGQQRSANIAANRW